MNKQHAWCWVLLVQRVVSLSCNCLRIQHLMKFPFLFGRNQISSIKLKVHEIDFSKLNSYKNLVVGDVLFSALGTTRKVAGSKSKQYEVDYTYQYEFAKMALDNGVNHYALVSSAGADQDLAVFLFKNERCFGRRDQKADPSNRFVFIKPPTLIRQADLLRPAEKRAICMMNTLNHFSFLQSQKPLSVATLAKND